MAELNFGQSDILARDTLAGTLWPQTTWTRDSLAGERVWPVSLSPLSIYT
jgi:hypothetical protein